MTKGANQHVTPHKAGGWQIKSAGGKKATMVTSTKEKAVTIARKIAQNQHSELVIHGKNGRIQKKIHMVMTHSRQKDSIMNSSR